VTRRILESQGVRIVEIDLVTSIRAAVAQIRSTAILLGKPGRGEKLVLDILVARDRLKTAPRPPYRTGLVIERGGYTQGPASIASALVAEAGFVPPHGSPLGYGGFLPLEQLITLRPDLLFVKDPPARPNDQGSVFFTHPALETLYPPERRIALPTRLTICGGPALVAAFDYLTDVLTRMAAPK
jgi:iron complex transport system substrate-binding protein